MERRQAVALAATASAVFFLGAAGLTANAAILGDGSSGGVGTVSPIDPAAADPAADGTQDPAAVDAAPAPAPTDAAPDTSSGASAVAGDEYEDDDHDDYEDDDHDEYEGGDDDD